MTLPEPFFVMKRLMERLVCYHDNGTPEYRR